MSASDTFDVYVDQLTLTVYRMAACGSTLHDVDDLLARRLASLHLTWDCASAEAHSTAQAEWEAALEKALADSERWVVQQLASIPVSEFPVLGPDGRVHVEPFYTVLGFAPTKYGVSVLGRASQKQVVNVAQRGGMCAVVLGHPPSRLVGPGPVEADVVW